LVVKVTEAELVVPPEATTAVTGEDATFRAVASAFATPTAEFDGATNEVRYPFGSVIELPTKSGIALITWGAI
jgi:hypothetical protein